MCPAVEVDQSVRLLLDSDGDGVKNYKDQCPGTPAGSKVDIRGCTIAEPPEVVKTMVIEFANDSADISSASEAYLRDLGQYLVSNPDAQAEIVGHASRTGAPVYNRELSMRRAEAVAETLVNDYSIERTRLKLTGQGFYQPRFSQPSEAAVSASRRVDIRVLQAQEVAGN